MCALIETEFKWRVSFVVCVFSELDSNFTIPPIEKKVLRVMGLIFTFLKGLFN